MTKFVQLANYATVYSSNVRHYDIKLYDLRVYCLTEAGKKVKGSSRNHHMRVLPDRRRNLHPYPMRMRRNNKDKVFTEGNGIPRGRKLC